MKRPAPSALGGGAWGRAAEGCAEKGRAEAGGPGPLSPVQGRNQRLEAEPEGWITQKSSFADFYGHCFEPRLILFSESAVMRPHRERDRDAGRSEHRYRQGTVLRVAPEQWRGPSERADP